MEENHARIGGDSQIIYLIKVSANHVDILTSGLGLPKAHLKIDQSDDDECFIPLSHEMQVTFWPELKQKHKELGFVRFIESTRDKRGDQ